MIRIWTLALVVNTLVTGARWVSADTVKLPDTPAGLQARAYIAAFSSGDEVRFRLFETEHRAESALKRRSIEDRVATYRELNGQYGRLVAQRVLDASNHNLVLAVESQRSGLLYMDFEVEESAPHKLTAVWIEGPIDVKRAPSYEKPLNDQMRTRVVERAAAELERSYVFEDIGKEMAVDIRQRLAAGDYDKITNCYAFARRLTDDLLAICNDKHLRVRPRAPIDHRAIQDRESGAPQAPGAGNFGFVRAEVLAGNVGYIKLDDFSGAPDAQPTAAAAMGFVANSDALIFDLRDNRGGSPNMIAFLAGYLFDEPVHLNSFHDRTEGSVRDAYSAKCVLGRRYGQDKPVYVLTSGHTFSAAEEFTYNLKHLGRATIVGETTGGGAHSVMRYAMNKYFSMSVPFARSVNPLTKTNWEGVGVKPHVEVTADQALHRACELALSVMSKNTSN
ncbi:MAG: S41 family peptidase [Phycisphaerales bacterium]|nr:MAG: S41 family peptidase [Phycisphaerales bacterium]